MSEAVVVRPPRITRFGWLAYLIAIGVVIVDQLSKNWVLNSLELPLKGTVHLFGPLSFTFVQNFGVSFGLLQAGHDLVRWALTAFAFVVAVVLTVWVRNTGRPLFAISIALMIGGAVGNAIDRMRFGWVVDFIDVQPLFFPWIFNVADSALTIGVALLLLDGLRKERAA